MNAGTDACRGELGGAHRLDTVASLVPPGSRVADIGTGHGLLPQRLLNSGRSPFCIATERTPLLLREVRDYPPGHRLAGALELRSGNGLAPMRLDDRIDVVVIAGLGGSSILGILERSSLPCSSFARWVLQPQTELAKLRRGLIDRGLAIVAERLVQERGRIYLALAAEPRADATPSAWPGLGPDDLLEAGPCLLRERDPLLRTYWQRQLGRLEEIICRGSRGAGRHEAQRRLDLARRILRVL